MSEMIGTSLEKFNNHIRLVLLDGLLIWIMHWLLTKMGHLQTFFCSNFIVYELILMLSLLKLKSTQ
jgi:hypothetical protein